MSTELLASSRAHLDRLAAAAEPGPWDIGARAVREAYETAAAALRGAPVDVRACREIEVAGADGRLRARRYEPHGAPSEDCPALVWLHGGGWVVGSLDSYDDLCRRLAEASGGTVLAIDYRLAPEHPFPAAPRDALAAVRDVLDRAEELGFDPERVVVGGDSAGGALAAVVARHAVHDGWPRRPRAQLLAYPVTDAGEDWPSVQAFRGGHYLTARGMQWYWDQYCPDPAERAHPDAAPLHAPDLSGLPPAHVVVASHDILRDQGLAYAQRLAQAGVAVSTAEAAGHLHGFLRWSGVVPESLEEIGRLEAVLRSWWERPAPAATGEAT